MEDLHHYISLAYDVAALTSFAEWNHRLRSWL